MVFVRTIDADLTIAELAMELNVLGKAFFGVAAFQRSLGNIGFKPGSALVAKGFFDGAKR